VTTTDTLIAWLATHGAGLIVGAIILLVLYRFARPAIHRLVLGFLQAQQAALPDDDTVAAELHKRADTIEELLGQLLRVGVIVALLLLLMSVLDLWPLLAGLGIIAAAAALAGQPIVMDYLMGLLILLEGQYFNGDWISVQANGVALDGEVEEVGLRRTILRDVYGVVHSVSNGLIRAQSNYTRVFSVASVEFQLIRTSDVGRAVDLLDEVGRQLAADPEWQPRLLEAPSFSAVTELNLDGATLRIMGRVKAQDRWSVAHELRRRLATAFAEAGIATGRWEQPQIHPPEQDPDLD
jgi:small-conductance mechanosensitive channel